MDNIAHLYSRITFDIEEEMTFGVMSTDDYYEIVFVVVVDFDDYAGSAFVLIGFGHFFLFEIPHFVFATTQVPDIDDHVGRTCRLSQRTVVGLLVVRDFLQCIHPIT